MTLEQAQRRIEELENELAYYKWELGVSDEQARIGKIKVLFKVPTLHAKLLLLMYKRGKSPLSADQFLTLAYANPDDAPDNPKLLSVLVHQLRAKMGKDAIRTIYGVGCHLDPSVLRMMRRVLEETP